MKRGDIARETVRNKIAEAFGENYVGVVDKKIYVEAADGPGGELIQFSITITAPKVPIERAAATAPMGNPNDWTGMPTAAPVKAELPTELSAEDKAKADELLKKLGF